MMQAGGAVGVELADTSDNERHYCSSSEPPIGRDVGHKTRGDQKNRANNVKNDGQCFHNTKDLGVRTYVVFTPKTSPVHRRLSDEMLKFGCLQLLRVFGDDEAVDTFLNIAVHEGREVVESEVYTMVGHSTLRKVVCANLGRAVAGAYHGLTFGGYIFEIFTVLFVINECAQAREGSLFILRLVTRFGTLYKNFLNDTGIRVLPIITQADS